MKADKVKICALVIFLASISIFAWVSVNNLQQNLSLPVEPSLTQEPLANFTLEDLVGDTSCSWPCWQGITPGVTKSSDALQLLQVSPLVSKSTVQSEELRPGIGTAQWYWEIGNSQFEGDMEWRDGIVRRIGLDAYHIFSIGEMIRRFGSPEKIEVIDCSQVVEAPQQWCAVFYYTRMGFGFDAQWERPENADDIQLSPSDPIRSVSLFEPSTIEEFFSYNGLDPQDYDLRDWKGYGNLLELYVK